MELEHGDKLDSRCGLCDRDNRTGPETMAVDWVERSNGTRLYVCARHARPLGRFGVPLEDLPDTPAAETCTGCGKLTRMEDMEGPRLCGECGEQDLAETIRRNTGGSMSFEAAMALVEDLMDEDEDVDPERAAEAMERVSGMPMVPQEEAVRWANEAAEGADEDNPHLPEDYEPPETAEDGGEDGGD